MKNQLQQKLNQLQKCKQEQGEAEQEEVIAPTRITSRGIGRGRNLELISVNKSKINYSDQIESFVLYFVNTWFEGNFSKDLWNHANTVGPRTNNHVEGFHHKLNNWITKAQPDIYELISLFKLIESGVSVDYKGRMIGYSKTSSS